MTTQNIKNALLAFTNTTHTKQSALALAQWHQDHDRFVLGTYGEALQEGWKGCKVGCMAKGKHLDYPLLFGIDVRIAYFSDKLFENVTDYKQWTVKLFASVAEGSDTALAFNRFMYWLIMDKQYGLIRFNNSKVVTNVGKLYAKTIRGETVTEKQWAAAAKAAYTKTARAAAAYAAYAAAHAAYDDAHAAYDDAAYAAAAYDAAAAHAAAAYDAAAAYTAYDDDDAYYDAYAAADAKHQHYNIMADKLCFYLSGQVD